VSPPVPRLHAITDDAVLALPDFEERALAIASAGTVAVHVRSGNRSGRDLATTARHLVRSGVLVFANERADYLEWAGAIGLHLPASGLPTEAARRVVHRECVIGRSTHDPTEARSAAHDGADYVFLGPIWETTSHPGVAGLGADAIQAAHPAKIIAIGGLTLERAAACRAAGAWGGAAIGALWFASDPGSAARSLLLSFEPG
jgi:thiamine-phosphate pyrophosphorylase